MASGKWTWEPWAHPRVVRLLAEPADDLEWCVGLDHAPTDAVVGKVLCVCAAVAIAREVLTTGSRIGPDAAVALTLLDEWIDDPTEERFDRICGLIFPPERSPDFDPFGLVWWALRTATSTAEGYGEAGWALQSMCGGAVNTGFSPDALRAIAERSVLVRQSLPNQEK